MRTPIGFIFLTAATALAVAGCSGGGGGGNGGDNGPPPNRPPTIASLGDQSINQDTSTAGIDVAVADPDSTASALTVSVSAADGMLLPKDGIALAGTGAVRSLTLTPAEAATGTTAVTVQVSDPQGLRAARTFTLAVNGVSASFTQFANETFLLAEDEHSRSLVGFSLDSDADDNDTVFEPLVQ